jgi:[amino group carrier protein]-lysine/ornithine hydrolase
VSPLSHSVRDGQQVEAGSGPCDDVADLLTGLVSIQSLSGKESETVAWLVERMDESGFRSHIDAAGNAVGTIGAGEREILLLGHIDTVPGDIPVRVEDGVLYGRGAVDAKGPLATFVAAGARADLPDGIQLTVIGAVGEETWGSPGATWLRDHYPRPDAVIIGEPSGWDGVVLGYKGSIALMASVERALSHSAGPETTAPEHIFAFWTRLAGWLNDHNGDREPGFNTLDATLRSVNTTSDGLHERVELSATFRLPVGTSSAWVQEQTEALANDVILDWTFNAEAYRTERSSPLVAPFLSSIRASGGTPRMKVKTGTSDMNVVGPAWGCPIVAYGPGDASYDHTPDEQIKLADVEKAVDILTLAIERIAQKIGDTA